MTSTFPESLKFRQLFDGIADKVYFFLLIWRAFNISSYLIIVWTYVSRTVFPIFLVHHSLRTNHYKMFISERSATCRFFFRNCTHILTRTQGRKFEDMFLVKIASKGTSLRLLLTQQFLTFQCVPCVKIKNTDIVLPVKEGPQLPWW